MKVARHQRKQRVSCDSGCAAVQEAGLLSPAIALYTSVRAALRLPMR
jgi:hypothetical protein